MKNEEFQCRIDDQGNYRKIRIDRNRNSMPNGVSHRLPQREPKIPQSERDFIFRYCTDNHRELDFVYLLNRAEQRGLAWQKSAAARSEYQPADRSTLELWLKDRYEPGLFGKQPP